MRSVTEFAEAVQVLATEAMTQCSAEQLAAIGSLLGHLGQACHALAAVRQSGLHASRGPAAVDLTVATGPTPFSQGGPAPSGPMTNATMGAPPGTHLPVYEPPPDDVHCEEAHRQRHDRRRIEGLRRDPVVWLEQVFYYLGQIGAVANTIPAEDPARGHKFDDIMLSIECFPGTRPTARVGALPDENDHDLPRLLALWTECYAQLKGYVQAGLLDHDDEAVILEKMGDRPGGALREPDFSNPPAPAQDPSPLPSPATAPAPMPSPIHVPPGTPFASIGAPIPEVEPAPTPPPPPPPPPASPPPPPVILEPGEILVQPGQAVRATLKDGTKVDLVNILRIHVTMTQPRIDLVADSLATSPEGDPHRAIYASVWKLER